MPGKIVLAGASGFIGTHFAQEFKNRGYEVLFISRQPGHISWNDTNAMQQAFENAEMVINLAGKSVNCRYTKKNKAEILRSRVETTRTIGSVIEKCVTPPKVWLNASTATIYRHATDRAQTEVTGEIGEGFSVEVAKAWEKTFFDFQLPRTRQAALRITIVIGKNGGVVPVFTRLVRFGLGGKQGNGQQMFSWIHIDDLFAMVLFIQQNTHLKGVFNCAAPNPIPNYRFMKVYRKTLRVRGGIPTPAFLLRIGAFIIGTEPELVLKSRWVIPEKLMEAGFKFKYPVVNDALQDVLKK